MKSLLQRTGASSLEKQKDYWAAWGHGDEGAMMSCGTSRFSLAGLSNLCLEKMELDGSRVGVFVRGCCRVEEGLK